MAHTLPCCIAYGRTLVYIILQMKIMPMQQMTHPGGDCMLGRSSTKMHSTVQCSTMFVFSFPPAVFFPLVSGYQVSHYTKPVESVTSSSRQSRSFGYFIHFQVTIYGNTIYGPPSKRYYLHVFRINKAGALSQETDAVQAVQWYR